MRYDETTLVFWILTIATFCSAFFMFSMEDAEGAAATSIFNETNTYWNDNSGNQKFTHTKDDYIVVPYCDDEGDIMVAYRTPDGSWEHSEVSPYDFAGATQWKIGGIINTDNNSLVILATGYVSSFHRAYYFTKFAGDDWDEWNSLLYLYQAGVSFYAGDLAINDTGIILGMCRKSSGNAWTYRLLDFSAWPVLGGTVTGTAWEVGTGSSTGFQIEANTTGKFWISWKDTDNVYKVKDFEKVLAEAKFHPDLKFVMQTFGFLDNGVCVAAGYYSYSTSKYPMYYYQTTPGTTFTPIRLDPLFFHDWNLGVQIVLRTGSSVPVIVAYSETDEVLYVYGANWDASEAVWQGSVSDTGLTSADEIFPIGASNSLWPQHISSGINWTRLSAGWAIIAEDDDPDPDEFFLINDGMEWTVDLTTADPEITTASLTDAEYGTFYEITITKTGGTPPFEWTLLIGPAWMSIGSSNGTLYGTPDGVGSETVRVKLADAVPRYDEAEWTLTIKPASSGEGEDEPVSSSFIFDDIGEMWMLLAVTAVFVALARTWKMATYRRDQR